VRLAFACACLNKPEQSEALAQGDTTIDRKIVKSADLWVSVPAPEETAGEVERIVGEAAGFVGHSTATKDSSV